MNIAFRPLRHVALLAVLAAIPGGLAATTVDRTLPAAAAVRVSVEIVSGSVRIVTWERDEVRVLGTLGDDVRGLEIEGGAREVEISLDLPRGRGSRRISADLEIHVPEGASLEIETVSADIDVAAVTGEVELESVSGDVQVASGPSSIEVSSVSGEISIEGTRPVSRVEVEVVSGNVRLAATPSPGAKIAIEAVSGDAQLVLPATVSARFDLETFSGSISSDFGPSTAASSGILPGKEAEFTTGKGEARISVEVFSGRIRVIRAE